MILSNSVSQQRTSSTAGGSPSVGAINLPYFNEAGNTIEQPSCTLNELVQQLELDESNDLLIEKIIAQAGGVKGCDSRYKIHTLGFASPENMVEDDNSPRYSFAVQGPNNSLKIRIHGSEGTVSLASKYGGAADNTLDARAFIKLMDKRIPNWRCSNTIDLNICFSYNGGANSVMAVVLNDLPRGVSVTGINGVGISTEFGNIIKDGERLNVFAMLDETEAKSDYNIDAWDIFIADERKYLTSKLYDPFIIANLDITGIIANRNITTKSDWVRETRL